jgi:hypothetical protein
MAILESKQHGQIAFFIVSLATTNSDSIMELAGQLWR